MLAIVDCANLVATSADGLVFVGNLESWFVEQLILLTYCVGLGIHWLSPISRSLTNLDRSVLLSDACAEVDNHLKPACSFSFFIKSCRMLPGSVVGRACLKASRQSSAVQARGLAAAASGSFQYENGEALGIKYAARDLPGPTTTLAIVARAGTRHESYPGLSDALSKFAFKV